MSPKALALATLLLAVAGPVLAADPAPSAPEPTMQFEIRILGAADTVIFADGPITARTPDDFLAFLQKYRNNPAVIDQFRTYPTVVLNSPGGSLAAGLKLGTLFRATGVETMIGNPDPFKGGMCASACAYAFLGGSRRLVEDANTLGFHQFAYVPLKDATPKTAAEQMDDAQRIAGAIVLYLKDMGIDPEVLAFASAAPASDINVPNLATLKRLKITTQ